METSRMNDLITTISSWKYISPPARELYFVTTGNLKTCRINQ